MNALPTTIPEYLDQLRTALSGADPAVVQDALHDAEEYLRAELAEQAGRPEAEVIASVASSYGAPAEVAEVYLATEEKVQSALRGDSPLRATRSTTARSGHGWARRMFGLFLDPYTYGSVLFMLLSLATGVFFFGWTVTGLSLSAGLSLLIIGLPFFVLFIAASRMLALVEGRLIEALLGVRMPRRPVYSDRHLPWLQRVVAMFTDARTWATLCYFLLMLPLGVFYFTLVVTGLALSLSLIASPLLVTFNHDHVPFIQLGDWVITQGMWWAWPIVVVLGLLILLATLHLSRWIARGHAAMAKRMLVSTTPL